MSDARFEVGDPVIWRSRWPGTGVGYVLGGRLALDEPEVQAIVQPTGSEVARRNGARGGPRDSLLPGAWDGTHTIATWSGPTALRLHPIGRPYAVLRWLDAETRRYTGWYVNLERPWTRTALGFDGADLILDVTVADDCSSWALKDEDELDWAVDVGKISRAEREVAHAAAAAAMTDLTARAWPFHEDAWPPLRDDLLQPVALPEGWNRP